MQADGKIGAHPLQYVPVVAAGTEVVLAMDLDPAGLRPPAQELLVVGGAQADSGPKALRGAQLFFSMASLPALPWVRLPPICAQVPAFTTLKSFGL